MPNNPTNADILLAVGNLQGTAEGIKDKLDSHEKRMDSHSGRIGKIERRQAWWAGGAAGVGAIIALLLKKIGFG